MTGHDEIPPCAVCGAITKAGDGCPAHTPLCPRHLSGVPLTPLELADEVVVLRARVATLEAVADTARTALGEIRRRGWWARATRALHYALDRLGDPDRGHVPIPTWVFRDATSTPRRFLVAVKPDGTFPGLDGGHETIEGVATARTLHESIDLIRPPEGTIYAMLTIEVAPPPGGPINEGAIEAINRLGG